jgi:hypothetical protein
LARPGGNVTGRGGLGPGVHAKQLELLREVVPKASRVANLFNPALSFHAAIAAEVEPAARSVGVTLRPIELRSPDDIDAAFATLAREPVDALLIFDQPEDGEGARTHDPAKRAAARRRGDRMKCCALPAWSKWRGSCFDLVDRLDPATPIGELTVLLRCG